MRSALGTLATLLVMLAADVVAAEVRLYERPSSDAPLVEEFEDDIEVVPIRTFDEWVEVRLDDGRVGWLQAASMPATLDLSAYPVATADDLDPPVPDAEDVAKGVGAVVVFLVLVSVSWYFLPTLIATRRKHHNRMAIFALNLLLGWTLLGWIVALVMSLTAVRSEPKA